MDKQKNVDVFENDEAPDKPRSLKKKSPEPKEYPPPTEKKFKVGTPKKVTITFRHNRTFELHIGQEVMRFEGRETKDIDKDLLDHPSFKQAQKYFIIKGI